MKNILMCHDDALVIDLVRISLEEKGVNIIGVLDCKSIISKIYEHNPLLIILDLNIAIQNNEEVLDLLREKNTAIVIFSSNLDRQKKSETVKGDYFVQKTPFCFDEIEKVVSQVMRKASVVA